MKELLGLRRMANADKKNGARMHGLLDSLDIFLMAQDARITELEAKLKCPTGAERKS